MHGDKSSGKQWTCKVCEKSLQTKARLIQHEKSHGVNLQEKVFSCEECKYSTNDKGYFADHKRRIHKSSEGLRMCMAGTCKNKPKSFLNNRLLVEHRKNHENVSCTECKKTFGAKRNMLRHIKNVHKKEDHGKTGNSNSSQIDMNLNFEQVDQLASVDLDQAIVLPFDM